MSVDPVLRRLEKRADELREEARRVSKERVGKALVWDIETSPLLAAVWGLKNDWLPLDAILRDSFIICGAWKWLGAKKVYSCECDSEAVAAYWSGRTEKLPDRDAVSTLRNMVDEADFIIGHNGDKFDLRKLNGFLEASKHFILALPTPKKSAIHIMRSIISHRYGMLDDF